MRLYQEDDIANRLCGSVLGVSFAHPMSGLVVRDEHGIRGAAVLNHFDGCNIDLTGVGEGCWTPRVVRELARYIFGALKCRRVTARTKASNERAIKALTRLGFEPEGVMRDGFPNEDALVYGLTARKQKIVRL